MTPNVPQADQPPPPGPQIPPAMQQQLQALSAPQPPIPSSAWQDKGPQVIKAFAPQMKLGRNEMGRLANRIQQDYFNAISDHEARMRRFQSYYLRWRNRTEAPALGDEEASNYRVPLTQWQTYTKLAKEISAMFGDDAEVVAKPVGPDDQRRVKKIGRFMSWRLFNAMKVINPATIFNFRKILFGRSHAYAPWLRDVFDVPMDDGSIQQRVHYDGPEFDPLWPDDLIVPAEDVKTLHDFSFVIRKYRATPEQLLTGEEDGRYQGITENWELITNFAGNRQQRDFYSEQVKREKDLSEGVLYEASLSAANVLIVHEWYGKWRPLKGKADGREDNFDRRAMHEKEIVVRYLPDLHLIVGVQDLMQMYPARKNKRPFVESSLVKDGSYWPPSFGELLETMEQELSANSNLGTQAMQFTVGPLIFYRPAAGFEPESFRYEPCSAIPVEDPTAVKVVMLQADLGPVTEKNQEIISYSERVTGQTDQNMGRASDRPNAPRTARQTMALLEEGDVRASLDTSVLREDWGDILTHLWGLEQMYGSPRTFFRVTEEDAGGAFPVNQGGAWLSEEDRTGEYDFDLKLATNAWSKETRKQNQLSLYQLDLQNPLVVNNPRALWTVLNNIHSAFGDDRFCDLIPEPEDSGIPVNPREEWTRCLEGEDVFVNPLDNDQLHMADHNKRLADAEQDPDKDRQAVNEMMLHVQEHMRQMHQKQLMAQMVAGLAQSIQQGTAHPAVHAHIAALHEQHAQQQESSVIQPRKPTKLAA